ncbi:hypothetical protein V8E55_010763 [Tylopilus felleus]
MDNSMGQSPCVVTAYLGGACNGGDFSVPTLLPNDVYTGPYVSQQNECQCSSIFYNTICACGLCQNHSIIGWDSWDFNCSTVYPGTFPLGIPAGTAVPQWALQDVTLSNMFNVTLAQSVGDNPESTATHVQSTGSVATPSKSVPASLTPSPSVSSSSKSNTGAIAGGVVGGVVGLALLVGVAVVTFSIMRKKRRKIPSSAQFADTPNSPSPGYTSPTFFAPQTAQPKLYDPSDPSTFPTTPVPTGPPYSASSTREVLIASVVALLYLFVHFNCSLI